MYSRSRCRLFLQVRTLLNYTIIRNSRIASYVSVLMVYKPTVIIFMALILFFLIHLLIVKLNYAEEDAKWPKIEQTSLYKGLYSPTDKVAVLTADNFNENVYGSTSAWLVQFYNSWCGHCIKFSPIWKALAADIYSKYFMFRFVHILCVLDPPNSLHRILHQKAPYFLKKGQEDKNTD